VDKLKCLDLLGSLEKVNHMRGCLA
jgi:hypothetical protein